MGGPTRTASESSVDSRHTEYSFKPPRPQNSWILYRQEHCRLFAERNPGMPQSGVSKLIAAQWRNESEEVKREWERKAEEEKLRHALKYPGYRYKPTPKELKAKHMDVLKKERKARRAAKKSEVCGAIPPAATSADADAIVAPARPQPPPLFSVPSPYLVPGYPNMIMQIPYIIPYAPEVHHGSGPPSPQISTIASGLESEENVVSFSTSVQSLHSVESQASSPSSQPPTIYYPSLPSSYQPSPLPYATQPPVGNTAPMWLNFLSEPQGRVSSNVAIDESLSCAEFQQSFSGLSSTLLREQSLESNIDTLFSTPNDHDRGLLAPPSGYIDVLMGYQVPGVGYNGGLFNNVGNWNSIDPTLLSFHTELDALNSTGTLLD